MGRLVPGWTTGPVQGHVRQVNHVIPRGHSPPSAAAPFAVFAGMGTGFGTGTDLGAGLGAGMVAGLGAALGAAASGAGSGGALGAAGGACRSARSFHPHTFP